jgi:hypothetical protein
VKINLKRKWNSSHRLDYSSFKNFRAKAHSTKEA